MTAEETGKILAVIYAVFPRAYERSGAEATRNAWAIMFETEHYKVVLEAVKKVLRTSKFAPTVSEVSAEIERYKEVLQAKLRMNSVYCGEPSAKCKGCDIYDDFVKKLRKCGAVQCPYDISEEKRKQYYLTESQINEMRLMIDGVGSNNKLLGKQ